MWAHPVSTTPPQNRGIRPLGDITMAQRGLACGTSAWLGVLDEVARTTTAWMLESQRRQRESYCDSSVPGDVWDRWRDSSAVR